MIEYDWIHGNPSPRYPNGAQNTNEWEIGIQSVESKAGTLNPPPPRESELLPHEESETPFNSLSLTETFLPSSSHSLPRSLILRPSLINTPHTPLPHIASARGSLFFLAGARGAPSIQSLCSRSCALSPTHPTFLVNYRARFLTSDG